MEHTDSTSENSFTCCICYDDVGKPNNFTFWTCSSPHTDHICDRCKNNLINTHKNCPICRANINNRYLSPQLDQATINAQIIDLIQYIPIYNHT